MEDKIWKEHQARVQRFRASLEYDPIAGRVGGAVARTEVTLSAGGGGRYMVPTTMVADPEWPDAQKSLTAFERLRCRHDFEFWCARCVTVRDKVSGQYVPFVLNGAQRRLTDVLEGQRARRQPLRVILLKARQWGGSTLIQMYMAWIQSCLTTNVHSLITAHVKDTSKSILGMYTTMLDGYPRELWTNVDTDDRSAPAFKPFERSTNIRMITGRGCRVTVSSAECQEALRGSDVALAHLSEVAFWPSTPGKSPADYMRTVTGTVGLQPLTLVAMESTANGTGNFFHDEWQRCVSGQGDKEPVFVAWYDIEMYRRELTRASADELWEAMTDYERGLWDDYGLDLEQIAWYHFKARECQSLDTMHAEFPTTPREAFVNSGANVFRAEDIERMRGYCRAGIEDSVMAGLTVWQPPAPGHEYMVTVDVGGRSAKADFSVVAVLDTAPPMEVVAQWRGHCDHDLLGDKAMEVAERYNHALLVVESNTLETTDESVSGVGVLARLAERYDNLYCRMVPDLCGESATSRPGLHTNRRTKAMMIDLMIRALRVVPAPPDDSDRSGASGQDADPTAYYIERDSEACNELAAYVCLSNGSYAAPSPKHDDILMTRAMALYMAAHIPPRGRDDTRQMSDVVGMACPWRDSRPRRRPTTGHVRW